MQNNAPPPLGRLEQIVNHFKVFHSDCYKILPKFELVSP
jgi:hypothetical protein